MRVEGEEGWPGQSLRCPGELATYPSCTRQTSDVSTGRQIVGRARARNSRSILLTTPKRTIHCAESAPMSKVANGVGVKVLRKIFFFEAVQRNSPLSSDDIPTLVATIQLTPPAAPRAPPHASDRNRPHHHLNTFPHSPSCHFISNSRSHLVPGCPERLVRPCCGATQSMRSSP